MADTLVLVPGLNCTERLFEAPIAALQDSRRIIVADHTQDDTMEAIAKRLLRQAPARFALAGLSMGGYVALEVIRLAPERVTRLGLLDTSARADTEDARQRREALIALAQAGRFDQVHAELWPKLVHPERRQDHELESVVREMARATGPEAFVREQRAIMSRRDARPMLPGIEIPTLVLVGAEDALTPPDLAREIAEMVEWASLVVVPNSGHLSTLEQPATVTKALRLWLAAG
jgi:pimeloyl-ACP methyl ester carboxylesterase